MSKLDTFDYLNASDDQLKSHWAGKVAPHLIGKKIVGVEWQSDEERDNMDWHSCAVKILVENNGGNLIELIPMRDDEGNDAGAIATNMTPCHTIPVI